MVRRHHLGRGGGDGGVAGVVVGVDVAPAEDVLLDQENQQEANDDQEFGNGKIDLKGTRR